MPECFIKGSSNAFGTILLLARQGLLIASTSFVDHDEAVIYGNDSDPGEQKAMQIYIDE